MHKHLYPLFVDTQISLVSMSSVIYLFFTISTATHELQDISWKLISLSRVFNIRVTNTGTDCQYGLWSEWSTICRHICIVRSWIDSATTWPFSCNLSIFSCIASGVHALVSAALEDKPGAVPYLFMYDQCSCIFISSWHDIAHALRGTPTLQSHKEIAR